MLTNVVLDISGFCFETNQAPRIAFIELSFRVNLRINCTEMIKIAMLEENEEKLVEIAKALSTGQYIFDDEDEIQIDRSKISIPLSFQVIYNNINGFTFLMKSLRFMIVLTKQKALFYGVVIYR